MKRILIAVLTIAILAGVGFALTYDADYYATRKGWVGAQNTRLDPLYLFMDEVGKILHEKHGTIYYVDNNSGNDDNTGLSWDYAFLTVTKAMSVSHAKIGTSPHYADRNTIFVRGDDFDEDWTLLAQKTDVIGVGSDDGLSYPTIKGNHPITAQTTSTTFMGCKFYNMGFQPQTASALWDIPANQHQIEFHGCTFQAAANSIYGITAVTVNGLVVKNCRFIRDVGNNNGFLTAAINIGNGTIVHTNIADNFIDAEIGIVVYSGISSLGGRITGNFIHATTLTIDDDSDKFWIYGNRLISEASYGGSAYDFENDHAVDNMITASDKTRWIPDPNQAD